MKVQPPTLWHPRADLIATRLIDLRIYVAVIQRDLCQGWRQYKPEAAGCAPLACLSVQKSSVLACSKTSTGAQGSQS